MEPQEGAPYLQTEVELISIFLDPFAKCSEHQYFWLATYLSPYFAKVKKNVTVVLDTTWFFKKMIDYIVISFEYYNI